MKDISSLQHPLIKHLVKLREKREYRYAQKRVVISGLKLIEELAAEFSLQTVLIENGFTPSFKFQAKEVLSVTPQIMKKVTGVETPEPIAAEIEMPRQQDLSSNNYLLILDGISDPGNLGTLLRSALALGWDGAFLLTGSTDPFNEKALRASKGACFKLPLKWGSWQELSTILHHRKFTLLAADMKGKDLERQIYSPPLALILGNEAHGLSSDCKENAEMISIPMTSEMESLNVASAGAILMYSLRRA